MLAVQVVTTDYSTVKRLVRVVGQIKLQFLFFAFPNYQEVSRLVASFHLGYHVLMCVISLKLADLPGLCKQLRVNLREW